MYNNQPMHKLLYLIRLEHMTIFATFDNHNFIYYNLIIGIEHPLWMGPYRFFSLFSHSINKLWFRLSWWCSISSVAINKLWFRLSWWCSISSVAYLTCTFPWGKQIIENILTIQVHLGWTLQFQWNNQT
jgi:hypothetical protein